MRGIRKWEVCFDLMARYFGSLSLFVSALLASQRQIHPTHFQVSRNFMQTLSPPGQQLELSLGQPPLSGREAGLVPFPPELLPRSPPVKEHIAMDNSHPEQQVQDMYALNRNMQRDIVFDDTQSGDPKDKGLKNSMDIGVNGNGQEQPTSDGWSDGSSDDMGIENLVDNAMSSQQHDGPVTYQSHSGSPAQQRLGNYMNIDVSGINVQATNTVEGGSAVATSNIEIKPLQIINCPPEVDEKLK